jgi:SAM-dependent methyltransferase
VSAECFAARTKEGQLSYDRIGVGYAARRVADPRWMSAILAAVGSGETIINVGAGTGNYEPPAVRLAVEPSLEMISQRPPAAAPVVQAVAEHLPVRSADIAMAVLTVHHWSDWRAGLAELRRVSARQVVLAYDTSVHAEFWLVREYLPEVATLEATRPSAHAIAEELGASSVTVLPIPWDFTDGVFPAHWRRPEAYLDPDVRRSCSALAQSDPAAVERAVRALGADLDSGAWAERHPEMLTADEYDAGFRLITRG